MLLNKLILHDLSNIKNKFSKSISSYFKIDKLIKQKAISNKFYKSKKRLNEIASDYLP